MKTEIEIRPQGEGEFSVAVLEGGSRSTHTVRVGGEVYERLTGGAVPVEELIRTSFEFLLEREPKESILSRFELQVIARYFPEYEREIRKRLRR